MSETSTVTVKPDIDLIEQAISDVIEEGGNYRDAAEYVAKCLAPPSSDSALRDRIARLITLDHLQLLQDFDVDGDLYRLDPECAASAYVTADAILAQQTPAQAARVLLPIFEKRHISWAQSKGRNPDDYTSPHSATADALRAIAGGE